MDDDWGYAYFRNLHIKLDPRCLHDTEGQLFRADVSQGAAWFFTTTTQSKPQRKRRSKSES